MARRDRRHRLPSWNWQEFQFEVLPMPSICRRYFGAWNDMELVFIDVNALERKEAEIEVLTRSGLLTLAEVRRIGMLPEITPQFNA